MEAEPTPEGNRGGEREGEPLPSAEALPGSHGKDNERERERRGHGQPPRWLRAVVSVLVRRATQVSAVPGALDRLDGIVDRRRVGVEGDAGPLGGEVDRRIDSAEPVEALLDPKDAAGAGHALELELDLFRRRCHAVTYTPQGYEMQLE
jgi:hypothetical protein